MKHMTEEEFIAYREGVAEQGALISKHLDDLSIHYSAKNGVLKLTLPKKPEAQSQVPKTWPVPSVRVAVLLRKRDRQVVPLEPDYCGFEIPDVFVASFMNLKPRAFFKVSEEDRKLVERAKGLLMVALGLSEQDAFRRLQVTARERNLRLADVAARIVEQQSLLEPKRKQSST